MAEWGGDSKKKKKCGEGLPHGMLVERVWNGKPCWKSNLPKLTFEEEVKGLRFGKGIRGAAGKSNVKGKKSAKTDSHNPGWFSISRNARRKKETQA